MRTKVEIIDSTERNSKKATGANDILLIHSLHSLEVFLDIRDILYSRLTADELRYFNNYQLH